ncbi:hypothetical protein XOO2480 [Xanthomonas oryzae pv. oryzae KACC 10331]|uniref:Uncharacterized protein n=1 Tax=Xanthomonas oryzae pv. oryzae (strain KACC10331 / KXO85) TaxID=291331 RepID=Q5GZY7_XANOR|nr:hypothetical protein XOO2480 [Xanthomonas oryzae pv. oryzae KACC 10331]
MASQCITVQLRRPTPETKKPRNARFFRHTFAHPSRTARQRLHVLGLGQQILLGHRKRPDAQHRHGHDHRRDHHDHRANHVRLGQTFHRLAAVDVQRQRRQEEHHRGDHRARERLVDRTIEHFQRLHAQCAEVFAHTVEHHDDVVDRKAHHRQQAGQHSQVELAAGQRHEGHGDQQIEQRGQAGDHRKLPLEAERDIDQKAHQHEHRGIHAIQCQILTDLRADEFARLHGGRILIAGHRLAHLFSNSACGIVAIIALAMWLQADHDVIAAAGILHLGVFEACLGQLFAYLVHVHGLLERGLHQRAAGKLQRVVEALADDDADRGDCQHQHQNQHRLAPAHEIDLGVVWNQVKRKNFH